RSCGRRLRRRARGARAPRPGSPRRGGARGEARQQTQHPRLTMDVPLEILDREVARAAAKLREARALLGRGERPSNPLAEERRVSSRTTYLEIAAGDPLRDALRAWLYALTLERVLWDDTARLEASRRDMSIRIEQTELGRLEESPRQLLLRI